jgi:hypothetical protein
VACGILVWLLTTSQKHAFEGEGASSSSSPPLKRQKTGAASASTVVSIDEIAAQISQLNIEKEKERFVRNVRG